jgi:hypothetical protein
MMNRDVDSNKYLAWLELQTWIWEQEESTLVFFDDEVGPREFMETETGKWFEVEVGHEDPGDDFTPVEDPRLIALLNSKKAELQPN